MKIILMLLLLTSNAFGLILEWDDVVNETGYSMYRRENEGEWVLLGNTGENVTRFVDKTVTNGITYEYKVCAYNEAGTGEFSNSVDINLAKVVLDGIRTNTLNIGR